jgi:hypothetical protein
VPQGHCLIERLDVFAVIWIPQPDVGFFGVIAECWFGLFLVLYQAYVNFTAKSSQEARHILVPRFPVLESR